MSTGMTALALFGAVALLFVSVRLVQRTGRNAYYALLIPAFFLLFFGVKAANEMVQARGR